MRILLPCRKSLIHKGHRTRPRKIRGLDFINREAGTGDQVIDLAIEMAAARESLPNGRQVILPGRYSRVRRASVLKKNKGAVWLQNSSHLAERINCVGNRAQRPCRDHRVNT